MKCLERNKIPFYYCNQAADDDGKPMYEVQKDEWGNEIGENMPVYDEPRPARANISWATGRADTEQFGVNLDYDRVIVFDKGAYNFTETTVLFVDKEPEFSEDGQPLYDYIVKRVSPSIHYVSVAIKRVDVT